MGGGPSVPPPPKKLRLAQVTAAVNDPNVFARSASTQVATLTALPLKKIFSAPFAAAIDAQKIMSEATAYFIQEMGVDERGDMYSFTSSAYYDIPPANVKDASGNQAYYLYQKAGQDVPCLDPSGVGVNNRTAGAKKFTGHEGTWEVSGNQIAIDHSGRIIGSQGQRSITLPFLSILNVPALSMQEISIDFKMEIKTSFAATADNSYNEVMAENSGNWNNTGMSGLGRNSASWYGAQTTAAVSNSKTATDKSSSASVYQVHMSAKHKVPVGMSMMLDFMTNNISDCAPQMKVSSDGYSTTQDPKSNILVKMGKI